MIFNRQNIWATTKFILFGQSTGGTIDATSFPLNSVIFWLLSIHWAIISIVLLLIVKMTWVTVVHIKIKLFQYKSIIGTSFWGLVWWSNCWKQHSSWSSKSNRNLCKQGKTYYLRTLPTIVRIWVDINNNFGLFTCMFNGFYINY